MTVKVIGLIQLIDELAFEQYRTQVGKTVEHYKGSIEYHGSLRDLLERA